MATQWLDGKVRVMRTDFHVYLPARLRSGGERVLLRARDLKKEEVRTFAVNLSGQTSIPDDPIFDGDPILFLQRHTGDGTLQDLTPRIRLSSLVILRTLDPNVLLQTFDAEDETHRKVANAFKIAQWINDERIRLWLDILSTKFLRLRLPNSGAPHNTLLSVLLREIDSGVDTDEVTDLLLYFETLLKMRRVLAADPSWRAVHPESSLKIVSGLDTVLTNVQNRQGLKLVQSLSVGMTDVVRGRDVAGKVADDIRRQLGTGKLGAESGVKTYGDVEGPLKPLRVRFTDLVGETVKNGRSELTVLYSGDPAFIRAYAARIFFFMTVFPEFHYHFALVGNETECEAFARELEELWKASAAIKRQTSVDRLSISFTPMPVGLPNPVSFLASARFYFVQQHLSQFRKGLWVQDVDLYPENDFRPVLNRIPSRTDIGVSLSNFLGGILPWKRVLAGNLIAYPTEKAKEFFNHAINYLDSWLVSDGSWMVDQNSLAYAVEQTDGLEISDFMSAGMPMRQSAMASLLETTVGIEQSIKGKK